MYGDQSRMAATVVNNNSASTMPSPPLITYYITAIEYDQRRTQDPYFIDRLSVRQRAYNNDTGDWETTQGNAFSVQRIMPVPYTLRIDVDFWTTNYNQKLELIEQLGVLFNPSMELQSTDNFIDWTSLTTVYQDNLTFSSRSVPVGNSNPIDIMTWKFYMPIWISSSIKIEKFNVIHRIITSIFKGKAVTDIQDDDLLLGTRQKITPYGYKLLLMGDRLQILPVNTQFNPSNDSVENPVPPNTSLYWHSVINAYGVINPGISMIALENPYMDTEIMGTIEYDSQDDRLLIYNIDPDTLPRNTLQAVDSVIDPTKKYPGQGLPVAAVGQRYLIVENIADNTPAWPGLSFGAKSNDIIEYDGTNWFISFDSVANTSVEFVTNITTEVQYRFIDGSWVKSYEGWYDQGDWRLII